MRKIIKIRTAFASVGSLDRILNSSQMKKYFVFFVAMTGIHFFASAQISLKGTVTESNTSRSLIYANIVIENSFAGTNSGVDGSFAFTRLKKGIIQLKVSYIGYLTYRDTFNLQGDSIINIKLEPTSILTEGITVSANATRADDHTPVTFTNIKSIEVIENQNLGQDLPYLINQTPSVVITSDAGAGVGYTGIRIRGSDPTRINVTINGIPYNDAESQGTYWVDIPDFVSSVDNIQIQRGVGTSTNGAGAFGASINLQTNPLTPKANSEINASFGSFNSSKLSIASETGLLNNHWAFDTRLSKIYSDGYIDRAFSDLKSLYFCGAYYGKKDKLKFITWSGNERTYQAWYGVPKDSLKTNRTYNPYTYSNQTDNYLQNNFQILYSYTINSKLESNVALHYTKGSGYYEEYRADENMAHYDMDSIPNGGGYITSTDLIRQRWLQNDFYGATWSLQYTDFNKLRMTFGGAWNNYLGDHFGKVIWARNASNSSPNKHYYDNTGEKTDFNLFGKISYDITKKIIVYVDLQGRMINYKFNGYDNDLNNFNDTVGLSFFNPKAGLIYELNTNNKLYASFAVGSKEPSRDDYVQSPSDKFPKPEKLYDTELGYQHKSMKLAYSVNVYYMNYKDQLILTGKINDVGSYTRTNIAKSFRSGIECAIVYKPIEKLSIDLNFTYSINKVDSFHEYIDNWDTWGQEQFNYNNTDLAFSPSIIAGGSIEYKPIKNFTTVLITKYVGEQYMDNTSNPNRMIHAYLTNDLRLNYTLKPTFAKEIIFTLMVNNIFNCMYESNGWTYTYLYGGNYYTDNYFYPQAGRNYMLGLKVKF